MERKDKFYDKREMYFVVYIKVFQPEKGVALFDKQSLFKFIN